MIIVSRPSFSLPARSSAASLQGGVLQSELQKRTSSVQLGLFTLLSVNPAPCKLLDLQEAKLEVSDVQPFGR
jgi:hypothetical protein